MGIAMSEAGYCAICGERAIGAITDYDYETGVIRDQLCARCTAALQACRDDVTWMRKAARYVERWRQKHRNTIPSAEDRARTKERATGT